MEPSLLLRSCSSRPPFRSCRHSKAALKVAGTKVEEGPSGQSLEAQQRVGLQRKVQAFLAVSAAALVCTCQPCLAEIQTVAPQNATSLARSLPKQTVRKGKVWLVFLAGATGLFGSALAVERNATLFPAIAKANKAMAASREASKKRVETEGAIDVERDSDREGEEAVLQGLAAARSNAAHAASSDAAESRSTEEPSASGSNGSDPGQEATPDSSSASNSEHKTPSASGEESREARAEHSSSGT